MPKLSVIQNATLPRLIQNSDFVGSTEQMLGLYEGDRGSKQFLMLTECGLSAHACSQSFPDKQLVGSLYHV